MLRRAKRSLVKQTPTVRFLWIFNTIAFILLLLWLVLGNFIAWQQETPFLKAREALIRQYPLPTDEQVVQAQSLKQAFIPLLNEARKNCGKGWSNILNEHLKGVADDEKPLPICLQTTLEAQSVNLNILINHLLHNPVPFRYYEAQGIGEYYFDLNKVFTNPVTYPFPSFSDFIHEQNFVLLYGLRKSQLGQQQEALDALATAWKLNQALLDSPSLIASLVNLIAAHKQATLLRRLNRLPANWQQRFPESDRHTPFFQGVEIEIFMNAEIIRAYPTRKTKLLREPGSERQPSPSLLSKLLTAFQQPYFTLSAVDFGQKSSQLNAAMLLRRDLCSLDPEESEHNLKTSLAPWNILGRYPHSGYGNQWRRLGRAQLNWELTEKVLVVKEQVAQTGKFPAPTPAMTASSACPSQRWRYQIAADGKTATIAIDNPPKWLIPSSKSDVPLTYTISLSKVLGQT